MIRFPKPAPRLKAPKTLQSKPHVIPYRVRTEVITRDQHCQWCGVLGGALDCHHRLPRSRGGKDEAYCLVAVHRLCHQRIHEHPDEAMERGFTVRSNADLLLPAQAPEGLT